MPWTGRFLLDTNIVIALLEGDGTVLSNLDLASEVFIPAVVFGEHCQIGSRFRHFNEVDDLQTTDWASQP